jgi:hypothetical protein
LRTTCQTATRMTESHSNKKSQYAHTFLPSSVLVYSLGTTGSDACARKRYVHKNQSYSVNAYKLSLGYPLKQRMAVETARHPLMQCNYIRDSIKDALLNCVA